MTASTKVAKPESPAKPEAPAKPALPATAVTQPHCRVLKIATCPSLSGKSTLTYHIGYEANQGIQLRVFDNTNIGFFSQVWVPYSVIQGEFAKIPAGQPITSFLLHALFRGKSVNTPAFLFAILKAEGIVQPAKDKQRQYDRMDHAGFLAMVQALIDSDVDLKVIPRAVRGAKQGKQAKAGSDGVSKAGDQLAKVTGKTAGKSKKADAVPTPTVASVDIPQFITAQPTAKPSAISPVEQPAMPTKKSTAKATSKAKQ